MGAVADRTIDMGALVAMILLTLAYVAPTWVGQQPANSYEVTVVLMLLNIGTLLTTGQHRSG